MDRSLKVFITATFIFLLRSVSAQEDSLLNLKLIKKIDGGFTNFTVDDPGNIFLINSSGQIKKLVSNFDSVGLYNTEQQYGNVTSVDATNPLKILVYYNDFTTAVVLGRFLEVRNIINIQSYGILQAKVITHSYDNNYWLFDEWDRKIKKINDNGKVLLESADFSMLFKESFSPSYLIDINGLLYLYDYSRGWLVFDYYGAMKNKYDFFGWTDVQVAGKNLTGRDHAYFYLFNPTRLLFTRIKLNITLNNITKVINRSCRWFILRNNCLEVYQAY
jgi:hypothetical protein